MTFIFIFTKLRRDMYDSDEEENSIWVLRAVVDAEKQTNLDKIYNCTGVESISTLRMRKAPFFQLVNLFRERHLLEDSIHTSRFRVIHHTFRRSIETASRYFAQVLYAIGELRGEMIRAPDGATYPKIFGS
uniref:Uncharacterized protein n=1 Tax=Setaria viridis TaxID=4556 RepID=A0A4U6W8K7_SETVI|nr:hypothetical protein SEVIR_1G140800v2 [Setaria viridis]